MRLILPLVILCIIFRCEVSPREERAAIRICKNHKGLDYSVADLSNIIAICNDGIKFIIPKRVALYGELIE